MSDLFVIKLGGSLVVPQKDQFDKEYLEKLKALIQKYVNQGKRFIIIIGGGKICRWYQEEADRLSEASNKDKNWIGAYVTRVNAEVVNSFFKPLSHDRAYVQFDKDLKLEKPVLVVGAWKPEKSTNMDAVLMAQKFKSKTIINLSNTDYVHDKDPHKFPDAKPINKVTWLEYEEIIKDKISAKREHKAGDNIPFDVLATQKAKELHLNVLFVNGRNLENLGKILEGKEFIGTRIG